MRAFFTVLVLLNLCACSTHKRSVASIDEIGSCDGESNCNTPISLNDGTVVGSVVKRMVLIQEYVKDPASGLTWSPKAINENHNDLLMTWEEANTYCEEMNTLNLKWRLPSIEDLKLAFHPENIGDTTNTLKTIYNKHLIEVLDVNDSFIWSSTNYGSASAWGLGGKSDQYVGRGFLGQSFKSAQNSVFCVGH